MKCKKILSVILALTMLLAVFAATPFSVGAATKYTYGDWEYEVKNVRDSSTNESREVIIITAYTGAGTRVPGSDGEDDVKVSIPNEIDGKPVAYLIGIRCFANKDTLTELTIPANLRYISGSSLGGCVKLKTINISPNNKYFEFNKGVLYMKDGSKTYGDYMNYHGSDIPDEYGPVFARFSLGVVDLPAKTTTIYENVFEDHTGLLNVSMTPAAGKLQRIESFAFSGSGIRGEMDPVSGVTTLIIPYGVTEIGADAFQNCKDLHAVSLPQTLKKIGRWAFHGSGVTNFHIPDSLKEVGDQAFGEPGRYINIYGGDPEMREKIKSDNRYQGYDETTGTGSSGSSVGAAIMIHHDPDKPFDHIYHSVATVPPTCTTPGLNIYICICGHMYYGADTIIQPSGHNYTSKKVYSTCFEQGYTLHTCKNCGDSYKDNYKKVLSHYRVAIPAVEPTATTAGSTAGVYCDDCGTILTQPQLIPPTGYTEKEDNGVKVTAQPEVSPMVTEVTDEATVEGLDLGDDKTAEKVYDIKIEKDGEIVQPEGDVIVKIPCDDPDAEVYHQEEDGTFTNMNAYNDEEGNKVFKTDSFSLYVVTGHVPEKYKLWVNNEQFSEDHLTVQCGEGTATFDPKDNILTLDNAQITKGYEKEQLGTGILSFLDNELTIIVNGDCTITETGGDGIGSYELGEDYQFVPHDITVKGDGKLTIKESARWYGYGFYCTGKLTLEGVDVEIESAATGVWANTALVVKDSIVSAKCSTAYSGIVINNGSAVFDNSEVLAQSAEGDGVLLGNDVDSSAMLVSSGAVTVKGKVGIDSDVEHSAVSVSGGKLVIEGQDAAFRHTFLTNVDQHILLGEGVEITAGAVDGTSVTFEYTAVPKLLGDVDKNGDIEIVDATYIRRNVAQIDIPFEIDITTADADGDEEITVMDATAIQYYLAHMKKQYNIGEPID